MISSLLVLALQAATPPTATKPADPIASDWKPIPDDELLVMTLAGERRVIIRLAPRYAPVHVENIRKLARAQWWDGLAVYRLQDNYVAQWGDMKETKPFAPGVIAQPVPEYDWAGYDAVTHLKQRDPYARRIGYSADGWPIASNGKRAWFPHCYGMVGVARELAPSTGAGSELYAVIGHAPRHLDRNVALVGRVLEGIEHLSSLPRGTGKMGVYDQPSQYTPIFQVRLASDLTAGQRPRFEYRAPGNPRFAAWVKAQENRELPFFAQPASGSDICNAMPPVRRAGNGR